MSREIMNIAEAETVWTVEGNMCGTARRGADALPRSVTRSRTKGRRRNLGGLMAVRSRVQRSRTAPGSSNERQPAMHGHEESDGCIVPKKPPNKTGVMLVAEAVEGRHPVKERASDAPRTGHCAGIVCRGVALPTRRCCRGRPSLDARRVMIQDRSRMRESRKSGSARGVRGNPYPYRDRSISSAGRWQPNPAPQPVRPVPASAASPLAHA